MRKVGRTVQRKAGRKAPERTRETTTVDRNTATENSIINVRITMALLEQIIGILTQLLIYQI